ncbi:MAG: hypothetical protein WKG06_28250 [Segetibacter sp.]
MTKKILTSLAILFTILFAVSSCKKDSVDKKPNEDIAASVAGQYEMNYISASGREYNLPTDAISGTVDIANKDKNIVDMLISITFSNGTSSPEPVDLEDVQLKQENSAISLYYDSEKFGTINNDELTINIPDEEGKEQIIKARKK